MLNHPLYIFMISLHGLVRGHAPELGRDADTGGQITYVLDLARALDHHPGVRRVDLLTRLIEDPRVSEDYAQPEEMLGAKARILRLPFGPKRYLRKELLWNHLDQLVDRCLHFLREQGQIPDIIHSHYADAGLVGYHLSQLLGVPQIHTGHSLGRCKRQRLLDSGRKEHAIERQFNLSRRIEAEERVLQHAAMIVASTVQERDEQYGMYRNFEARHAQVIPPGIVNGRFATPRTRGVDGRVRRMIDRFLREPEKPLILTICRPAPRKNLLTLLEAYGESPELQSLANLAIVAGQRDDIQDLEENQAREITDLILAVDRYDLYGKVALPKQHSQEDVPQLYRLAAQRRGVFVNPALTEPFGLTLLEAAASGLPVVSTEDGGPRDIIANCRNGLLIDPMDKAAMAESIRDALLNRKQWRTWAQSGRRGAIKHYSWKAHTEVYLNRLNHLLRRIRKQKRRSLAISTLRERNPLPLAQWALLSDIDNTLVGDQEGLSRLLDWLANQSAAVAFGVATGRTLDGALRILRGAGVLAPDVLITAVGTEIYYGPDLTLDEGWSHYIRHRWRREDLARELRAIPGLRLQKKSEQREFKLCYTVNTKQLPPLDEIEKHLTSLHLHANLVFSHGKYLDVLPERASKGHAVRYLAYKWGLPLERFLVAGDSGNDLEMMHGDTLGVIVGNFSPEIAHLRDHHQVYFATAHHAGGILEGIRHYRFGEAPTEATTGA